MKIARHFLGAMALAACASACGSASDPVAPPPDKAKPTLPANPRIAFVSTRDGERSVYLASADGSGAAKLTVGDDPDWSPDGRQIVFHRLVGSGGQSCEIRVIKVDGSGERFITMGCDPAWSPDGKRILFHLSYAVGSGPNRGIFSINPDGTGLARMVHPDFADVGVGLWGLHSTAIAPDGRIAFVRADGAWENPWRIFLANANGSNARLLTDAGADQDPSWSPDGSKIAFGAFRNIGVMNADGSDYTLVRSVPGYDPDWSPDGRSLIFMSHSGGDPPPETRIYRLDIATGTVGQFIPDTTPNATYRDESPVWARIP